MRSFGKLMRAAAFALAAGLLLAGCGSDETTTEISTPANAKFVGTWRLPLVDNTSQGIDVTFNQNYTFEGSRMGETSVAFTGSYTVDGDGQCTGTWTATSSTSVGKIEAVLESDTVMYLRFITTNAYDNPDAVNGYIFTEHRGSRI